MKRIYHIADTHIGYSAYRKMDEATGLNQREVDAYDAFKQFVDYALTDKPDAILHAGDLFDSIRPTNRAISFVLSQLLRLSNAHIPVVIIAGNHEMPRLKETGCVFSLFEHIPYVYAVYENRYELIEISDLKIHAIPHCDDIEAEKKKIHLREGINIVMLHAGVEGAGLPVYMMHEFNEQGVTLSNLAGFDYIALGHYHLCTQVARNAYYSGSTEHFSFSEVDSVKGFLEVAFEESGKKEVVFHELDTRPMLDLAPINCSGMDLNAVSEAIRRSIIECDPADKIVRLKVFGIPLHIYHALDFDEQSKLTRSAVHFELKYEFDTEVQTFSAKRPAGATLREEFDIFITNYTLPEGVDKAALKEIGLQYMQGWEDKEK